MTPMRIDGTRISRREFLTASAAALAAAGGAGARQDSGDGRFLPFPDTKMPSRPFGRSGARVSLLTFGAGGSWMTPGEDVALRTLTEALDAGVNIIDTAEGYGNGNSERIIGRLMPERRKSVLLQTKIAGRSPDDWWKRLENSLNRLRVDYVDSLQIHHLEPGEDLAALEVKGGPIEQLQRAKEQKLCRWIGVSCHSDSRLLVDFIRRHELDNVMISLNVATNGFNDMGFEEIALPETTRQGLGVTAMKVMGVGRIADRFPGFDHATCLRYVLSLPVSTATITMPNLEHVRRNIETVMNFKPFSADEMQTIKAKAQKEIQTSFRAFMRGHRDLA